MSAGALLAVVGLLLAGSQSMCAAQKQPQKGERAFLGATVGRVPNASGFLAADVIAGSAAEKAGFTKGNVLKSFDGKNVTDPQDLRKAIAGKHPGDEVPLKFTHEGKEQTVKVTLGSMPAGRPK
jgi:S1-C subfamily serine protease